MKAVIEVYYCDFCGNQIASYPFDPVLGNLPDGHSYADNTQNYQTVSLPNTNIVFCSGCCSVLKEAIGSGLVSMESEFEHQIRYKAGWRKDGDNWIPKTLYDIKKEKGLIND